MILYFYSHRVIFRYQADRSDWCDPQPSSSFLVALALISFECPEPNRQFQSTLPPTEQKSKIETEGYPMPSRLHRQKSNKTTYWKYFLRNLFRIIVTEWIILVILVGSEFNNSKTSFKLFQLWKVIFREFEIKNIGVCCKSRFRHGFWNNN